MDCQTAEELAEVLAPELSGRGLRVVEWRDDWPALPGRAAAMLSRPTWIGGEGPTIGFGEPIEVETLVHELAHILTPGNLPQPEPMTAAAMEREVVIRDLAYDLAERDLAYVVDPWHGHDLPWIRTALHLLWRAGQAGYSTCLERAVIAGETYALSSDFAYELRLGFEPQYMRRWSFEAIAAEPPLKPFNDLWHADIGRFQNWKDNHGREVES